MYGFTSGEVLHADCNIVALSFMTMGVGNWYFPY